MKTKTMLCGLALAGALAVPVSAATTLINLAVSSAGSTTVPDTPATTPSGAAVLGTTGDEWNLLVTTVPNNKTQFSASGLALTNSTGAETGITLSYSDFYRHTIKGAGADGTGPGPLRNGWFSRGDGTFTLSGFAAGDVIDLVVFNAFKGGEDRGVVDVSAVGAATSHMYSINSTPGDHTAYAAGIPTAESPAPGNSNYVQFTGLTADGSGNLIVTFESDSGFSDFNGFQLNIVPEPSSTALLGLGGFGLLLRRRR